MPNFPRSLKARHCLKSQFMEDDIFMEALIMEAQIIEGKVSRITEGPYACGGAIDEREFISHRKTDEQGRGVSRRFDAGGTGPFVVAGSRPSWPEEKLVPTKLQVSPPALHRFGPQC